MSCKGGHHHPKSLHAPIGFVFLSLVQLTCPFEAFGRTFYLADGNNGTTNLLGRFPRMTNSPGTTGGADSHTLTVAEIPSHNHTIRHYYSGGASSGNAFSWNVQKYADTLYTGSTGGGGSHENRPAFIELIPYQAVS